MDSIERQKLEINTKRMIALVAYATCERRGLAQEPGNH